MGIAGSKEGQYIRAALQIDHKLVRTYDNLLQGMLNVSMETLPLKAQAAFIAETCKLLECDRSTLFLVDNVARELVIKVAAGAKSIRVPMGEGIAGTVAAKGVRLNIPDAYADPRFDSHHDSATGYKTQSILCHPVKNQDGDVIAVLQAINKNGGGVFTEDDEYLIEILGKQAGVTLHNAKQFDAVHRSEQKQNSLLDLIKTLHDDTGVASLLFTLTNRIPHLLCADRTTIFLADRKKNELVSMQGAVEIRIPADKGIAGECFTTETNINIPDAYKDARFNQAFDAKSGYHTKTILAMVIRGSDKSAIGVVQVINKEDGEPFDAHDIDTLDFFLGIAGPILHHSQLLSTMGKKKEPAQEAAFDLKQEKREKPQKHDADIIEEGEEDEEDD